MEDQISTLLFLGDEEDKNWIYAHVYRGKRERGA